jgi:hypothetical protein
VLVEWVGLRRLSICGGWLEELSVVINWPRVELKAAVERFCARLSVVGEWSRARLVCADPA